MAKKKETKKSQPEKAPKKEVKKAPTATESEIIETETGFEHHEIELPETENPELDEELSVIYGEEEDGEEPDMSHLDKAPKLTVRKLVLGLLVFFAALSAVTWIGFFIFTPRDDAFSGDKVSLTVQGPININSGEMVSFDISYRNAERVPLGTASLELRLPDSFTLLKTEPEIDDRSWKLGSIPPQGRGKVKITGIFLAPLEKELDIQAIASYRPADFNSEFQKVSTKTVIVNGSVLEVDVDGPSKAMPGDTVDLAITYENVSETKFEDLMVKVEYPTGFIPESSDPEAANDDISEWRISELDAKGIDSIKITGSFASDAHGEIPIKAIIGYLDPGEAFQKQSENSFIAEVTQGQLITSLILNGKTENQAVRFGDTLHYAITYRNTGSASLGNVGFTVNLETEPESGLLSWNDLEDDAEGRRNGETITWTSKHIKSLERIEEDEEGIIEFSIPIADSAIGLGDGDEFEIDCWVESSVESIDGDVVDRVTKTQPLIAKVLSDTEISVTSRYYDDNGIPIGSGKMPPEVGETTTYRVYWSVANSLHDLADLKLSVRLPENVAWTGESNVDAGDLEFDAADRKLIWTLNWMPTSVPELNMSFDVSITPSDDQEGKIPTLIDATIFEATDRVAGEKVLISNPPLTTALKDDPHGAGHGRIQ
jgi:hypothetical protein